MTTQPLIRIDRPYTLEGTVLCVWREILDYNPTDHPRIIKKCQACDGYYQHCNRYTALPQHCYDEKRNNK